MALLTIVPAKWHSTRVPLKNYREFHAGKSLVDILIEKLKRDVGGLIYLSCENPDAADIAGRHGIEFHHRPDDLCSNDVPLHTWVRRTVAEVSELASGLVGVNRAFQCDVLWAQCVDPLFDEFAKFVANWKRWWRDYDSSCVIYPRRKYLLDENRKPLGWGFGPWHCKSQLLPVHYEFGFTASILTREWIRECGYHIGARPLFYESSAPTIDIDTPEEFELARQVYAARTTA